MKTFLITLLSILIILIIPVGVYILIGVDGVANQWNTDETPNQTQEENSERTSTEEITFNNTENVLNDLNVTAGQTVSSPLEISGSLPGTWYFGGSFTVKLVNQDTDETLAIAPASNEADWMTEDQVPFSATLTFQQSAQNGALVLERANPSALPENDSSIVIPVVIEP